MEEDTQLTILEEDTQQTLTNSEGEDWLPFLMVFSFDNEIWLLFDDPLMFILDNQNLVDVLSQDSLLGQQKPEESRMTKPLAPRVIFWVDDNNRKVHKSTFLKIAVVINPEITLGAKFEDGCG